MKFHAPISRCLLLSQPATGRRSAVEEQAVANPGASIDRPHDRGVTSARKICNFLCSIFLALLLSTLELHATSRPPWCSAAKTQSEIAICDNQNIWGLDQCEEALFSSLVAATPNYKHTAVHREEAAWVAARDNCGASFDCLRHTYHARISRLEAETRRSCQLPHDALEQPPPGNAARGVYKPSAPPQSRGCDLSCQMRGVQNIFESAMDRKQDASSIDERPRVPPNPNRPPVVEDRGQPVSDPLAFTDRLLPFFEADPVRRRERATACFGHDGRCMLFAIASRLREGERDLKRLRQVWLKWTNRHGPDYWYMLARGMISGYECDVRWMEKWLDDLRPEYCSTDTCRQAYADYFPALSRMALEKCGQEVILPRPLPSFSSSNHSDFDREERVPSADMCDQLGVNCPPGQ